MNIKLFSEQEKMLRILADAWGIPAETVALSFITIALQKHLTDEQVEMAHAKELVRVQRFRERESNYE